VCPLGVREAISATSQLTAAAAAPGHTCTWNSQPADSSSTTLAACYMLAVWAPLLPQAPMIPMPTDAAWSWLSAGKPYAGVLCLHQADAAAYKTGKGQDPPHAAACCVVQASV
jgi:hypothetical protein